MQIVVIMSRPQRVKSFISSCTLLSRLFKPVAYTVKHVFPAYLLTWLLKITLQHENMISYEIITKCCNHLLRYCLAYFGDKCEILIHITFWQKVYCGGIYHIIIDSAMVSKNIGQVFGVSLHWKPRVVMTPTLSSHRVSLWWQLAGTTVMTKLALRQFSILAITHGLVNIRITIAIHCHSQRFLESEYLTYYRV